MNILTSLKNKIRTFEPQIAEENKNIESEQTFSGS